MKKPMWMVRAASGGRLADEFHDKGVVAIGWSDIGDLKKFNGKAEIVEAIRNQWPDWKEGKALSSASQLIRFRDEFQTGDRVITYDSSRRSYWIGTITGEYRHASGVVATSPHLE